MQERAHISVCPVTLQVIVYLARELCRQMAAYILSRLTPFSLISGRGVWGGGHFVLEAEKMHMTVRKLFCSLLGVMFRWPPSVPVLVAPVPS